MMSPVGDVSCTGAVGLGHAAPPPEDHPLCVLEVGIVSVAVVSLFHSVRPFENLPTISLAGVPNCFQIPAVPVDACSVA